MVQFIWQDGVVFFKLVAENIQIYLYYTIIEIEIIQLFRRKETVIGKHGNFH